LEHASITVLIKCSRACSHQIVRHRLNSFSQESQRYVRVVKPKLEIKTEDDIVDAYLRGLSCRQISEITGTLTEWQIYTVLQQREIKRRSGGSRGIVNHSFFTNIDSPIKAYLLGMILADGSVSRNEVTLTQHRENIWYLHRMYRAFIQPGIKIHKDNGNCQRLAVSSKQIVSDLQNYGIVPNKTRHMTADHSKQLWASIPPEYRPDFLRGFLDGDGSVFFGHQTNKSKTPRHFLQWLGHAHTLDHIRQWFSTQFQYTRAGIHKVSGTAGLYRYQVSHPEIIQAACKILYQNFQYPFGHPQKTARVLQEFNFDKPIYSDPDGMQVILPPSLLRTPSLWRWYKLMEDAALAYSDLLLAGCKPEDARFVLPNATKTEIAMTCNLRQWLHVFKERALNKHAQWEIRSIFGGLLTEFREAMPDVFGDLDK
jgi:thymidylate synthase (FAD)